MTWGGLRGGISIAMAINLSDQLSKDLVVGAIYNVVLFSIVVKGLSLGTLVNRLDVKAKNRIKGRDKSLPKSWLHLERAFFSLAKSPNTLKLSKNNWSAT